MDSTVRELPIKFHSVFEGMIEKAKASKKKMIHASSKLTFASENACLKLFVLNSWLVREAR
jgi:hypothetical protein